MSKYKIGDVVYLIHDGETRYIVREVKTRILPIQDGSRKNELVVNLKIVKYRIEDATGRSLIIEEEHLR